MRAFPKSIIFLSVCWDHKVKSCVNGHNLEKYSEKGIKECKSLCVERDGCVGFEYGVEYGGSSSTYKARDCQLSSSINSDGCDGADLNLDLYIKIDCSTRGEFLGVKLQ